MNGYLDLIRKYYKTEITSLDYARQSEKACRIINTWVEDKTRSKIKEIIQPGILDALTRLVLVNAIYFKGKWKSQFDRKHTSALVLKISHHLEHIRFDKRDSDSDRKTLFVVVSLQLAIKGGEPFSHAG